MVYSFSEMASLNSPTMQRQEAQEDSATAPTRDTPPRRLVRSASISGDLGVAFLLLFMRSIIHIREAFSRQILIFFQISYGHKCLGIKDLRFGPRPFWQKSSTVSSFFLPPIPPQAKCSSLPRGGGRSGPKDYLYSPCRVGGFMLPCSGGSNRSGLRTGGS